METKIRNSFIIFLFLTLVFFFLSGCNIIKPQENVKIVKFIEDNSKEYEQKGFQIVKFSIDDFEKIEIPKVWITLEFIKNDNNAHKIKYLLDKEYNILIEGNVYVEDVYNLLDIDEQQGVTKISKEQEILNEKDSVLHRSGMLIVKNNGKYFTMGFNRENINDNDGFLKIINMHYDEKQKRFVEIVSN